MWNRNNRKVYNINDKSAQKNVVKFIALIICSIFIFALIFMHMVYQDNLENVYSVYLEKELESFQRTFENFYVESKNSAISIYNDVDIQKVSAGVSLTKDDLMSATRRLRQYKNVNIYTESIYFYDASEHLFYSSEHNVPWEAENYTADSEILSLIGQRKAFVERIKQENKRQLYTIIVYPFDGNGDAVVINYYENVFSAFFREGSRIVVVDQDKKCIASTAFSPGTDLSGEKYVEQIFSDSSSAAMLEEKINDKQSIVAYKKTADFVFINAEYTSFLTGKVMEEMVSWFLICILFILAIIWLLFTYGRRMYEVLYRIFDNIENMKFKIQSDEKKMNNEKMNDFLKVASLMTDFNMKEAVQNIDFNIATDEKLNMALLRIDRYKEFMKENSLKTRESIRFSIMNVLGELLEKATRFDLNAINDCEVIVLYNTQTCDLPRIKEIIKSTQKLFLESMDITISAFIGNGADNIFEISTLYQTVSRLTEYGFYEGPGCILTPDYMQKYSEGEFEDTIETRVQFAGALKTGSYDKMLTVFEKTLKLLENANPTYLKGVLLQYAFQLRQSVLRVNGPNMQMTDICRDIFNDIIDAETLDEVILIFKEAFRYISENIASMKDEKYEGIVKRVEKLVEQNYSDINFSRNTVSEKINMNVKYADSLFKKQTQKTISNYITDYRLEKSKELLTDTEHSVNEIAGLVGYSGGSHFIYSFKKKYGQTPNEYRKNQKR